MLHIHSTKDVEEAGKLGRTGHVGDPRATYTEVQGLSRGLRVLVALNARARTKIHISAISRMTGLHRTTVKRLIETLRHEGYVTFDEETSTYKISSAVKRLSSGFVDDEWLAEVAMPIMRALSEKTIWPTDLTTFDSDAMIVRETTHHRMPVFFDKTMTGERRPVLLTSAGRAFFFASSEERQNQILTVLRKKNSEEGMIARDPERVATLGRSVVQHGCAVNDAEWRSHANRSAIAVPVVKGRDVIGSLNILFHSKAMTLEEAISHNLPLLKKAACEISKGMTAMDP